MKPYIFHESDVIGLNCSEASFELLLDDVYLNDSKKKVKIIVEVVAKILLDTIPVDSVSMAAKDGEVLSLEIAKSGLFLLIEWQNYSPRANFTHAYEVLGSGIELSEVDQI